MYASQAAPGRSLQCICIAAIGNSLNSLSSMPSSCFLDDCLHEMQGMPGSAGWVPNLYITVVYKLPFGLLLAAAQTLGAALQAAPLSGAVECCNPGRRSAGGLLGFPSIE